MKNSIKNKMAKFNQLGFKSIIVVVILGCLALGATQGTADNCRNPSLNPNVVPPYQKYQGKSYGQWSANWWQWAFSLPTVAELDKPFTDDINDPDFQIDMGQSGNVWFLGAPLVSVGHPMIIRTCDVPSGKALFIALINVELSDLEGYETPGKQRRMTKDIADHFVRLFCSIDSEPLEDIEAYRVSSPPYEFVACYLNAFNVPSGEIGTSVSDGYWIMLRPLSPGNHTIHFGGAYDNETPQENDDLVINMIYDLNVMP